MSFTGVPECKNNGSCHKGYCYCKDGFEGPTCSQGKIPTMCMYLGTYIQCVLQEYNPSSSIAVISRGTSVWPDPLLQWWELREWDSV